MMQWSIPVRLLPPKLKYCNASCRGRQQRCVLLPKHFRHLLGRIVMRRNKMRRRPYCYRCGVVCLCVCWSRVLKRLNRPRCRVGCRLAMGWASNKPRIRWQPNSSPRKEALFGVYFGMPRRPQSIQLYSLGGGSDAASGCQSIL